MPPKFELRIITDRSCELSDIIADYPHIMGIFTDSDCENGASNSYARSGPDEYHLCDYHLGQLVRSGLTDYKTSTAYDTALYVSADPSASWNLPK
jgi:hypothetical protein